MSADDREAFIAASNMEPGIVYEHAGASFVCHDGGCETTRYVRMREPEPLARQLLEETTGLSRDIRRLPLEYPIPNAVRLAAEALYEASLAWVEVLDRKAEPARNNWRGKRR